MLPNALFGSPSREGGTAYAAANSYSVLQLQRPAVLIVAGLRSAIKPALVYR